jgi:hypothetical protein
MAKLEVKGLDKLQKALKDNATLSFKVPAYGT